LALFGAVALVRRRGADRAFALGAVASFAIAGVAFPILTRAPETSWWAEIVSRFYPLPDLFAALLAGAGIDRAIERPLRARPALVGALLALWWAVTASLAAPMGVSAGRHLVGRYADDLLASLRPNAILIGQGDLEANAVWEAQVVRDVRPDARFVVEALLPAPWYARQVAGRIGGYAQPEGMAGIRLLLDYAHGRRIPAYVSHAMPQGLVRRYPAVPEGIALRVLPPGERVPSPAEVEHEVVAFFERRQIALDRPRWLVLHEPEAIVLERYAAPFRVLEGAYAAQGDAAGAGRCRARALALVSR
jgi:hypothetical protein